MSKCYLCKLEVKDFEKEYDEVDIDSPMYGREYNDLYLFHVDCHALYLQLEEANLELEG